MKRIGNILSGCAVVLLFFGGSNVFGQVQVTRGSTHHYSVAPVSGNPIYDYHWSVTPGGTSSVFGTADTTNDVLWDGTTGLYTITVYPTKPASGCAGSNQTLEIEVVDMNIVVSPTSSIQCPRTDNQSGDFSITINYTGVTGAWSFKYSIDGDAEQTEYVVAGNSTVLHIAGFVNASKTATENHTIRISSVTSFDNYTLNFTGNESDAASRLHTVAVEPMLNINLGIDTTICAPDELEIDAGYYGGFYNWNNGANTQTIIAREGDGQIWVRVTDSNGCIGTDTLEILACSSHYNLVIPNAFTPNGDGYNDYWLLKGYENYPNISVKIYDPWGIQVFQSDKGYSQPWDGTSNGKKLPMNAYYYVIEPGDGSQAIVGSLTLIR
jgi:gliding motility-associated-like protein